MKPSQIAEIVRTNEGLIIGVMLFNHMDEQTALAAMKGELSELDRFPTDIFTSMHIYLRQKEDEPGNDWYLCHKPDHGAVEMTFVDCSKTLTLVE
jgi:hypothetical protein